MKQIVINKITVVVLAGFCVFNTLAAGIDQVVMRQRWPWSRLVDIDYVLSCESAESWDINVTVRHDTETLTLPLSSLSGDLFGVSDGSHRIVWDPMASSYTNRDDFTALSVELTAIAPPLYMIVDLTKDAGADGQIEYVFEADLHTNKWGSWVENPVTNRGTVIPSVVWTGVTNDMVYATDKLVLRRIPSGTYMIGGDGYTQSSVTLTKDFYAGVFQLTQAQWRRVMGGTGGNTKPQGSIVYDDIRGATNDVPDIDWPATGSKVSPASFMGQLRLATMMGGFDLPTEAQWEYLCRAGTTTVFNDGNADAKYDGSDNTNNGVTNKYLDALGWYKGNCAATMPVGQKIANAWGLYDTHGNGWEWGLDWQESSFTGGVDPSGPVSGSRRMRRGGGRYEFAANNRSAFRGSGDPYGTNSSVYGLRIVLNLPTKPR